MPQISVIVPVYNVEKYLSRCIDSILAQTFTDFELILIDDGSPDNCGKICDEYAAKDKRIKVIHKKNGGLSDARNIGIDNSRCEYLTFIDSDDWIATDYLLIMYQNMIEYDVDISAVNLHKEYNSKFEKPCEIQEGLYEGIESLKFLYEKESSMYADVACAKLYKKKLFQKIRYPIGKIHEDAYTTYKLYFNAKKVYFSKSDLYFYYQRNDSIMNEKFSLNRVHEYYVYKERADFFKENKLEDLFLINEKTNLACIYSLTIKIKQGKFSKKEKRKWFKIFREDIKQNYKYLLKNATKKQMISVKLYKMSASCYCLLHNLVNLYRKFKKKKRIRKAFRKLKVDLIRTKLFHKNNYAFLCMTPLGGNLGDHALAIVTKEMFSPLHFIELPCINFPCYFSNFRKFKKIIGDKTLFFMPGGNLGTLWYNETEFYLRKMIQEFSKNDIIVLPNTVYYEDDLWGKRKFDESLLIYNRHEKLKIFVRDEISFNLVKSSYRNVFLKPDMVMMLNVTFKNESNRDGCLLCLRKDVEKTMEQVELEEVTSVLTSRFEKVTLTDTVISKSIKAKKRKKEVYAKLQEFSRAELVVTDRLHGMIFAAVTGTPCIVVKSKSHKLKGCYKWIENLEYIKLADNLDDVVSQMDKIQLDKKYTYNNSSIKKHFEVLKQECYDVIEGN